MVQIYVSQLRKAFKGSGNGAEIVTRGHGYELRLGAGEVDARRFERLVAEGAPREALALWRGPPLDDVATEPFAGLEIRRLEELRLTAIEQALEQDLAAGRHAEAIPEIQALLAHEPLREHLHGLRMLALYRSGRQADALGAYRRARDELVNAIGVEPGPELRRLHEAILRQDPSLDLPLPAELPPELEAGTPLVGREAELDALREHWRGAKAGDGAEVLLAGAGGIGKTRLAAELAAEVHRDGGLVLYASGAGSPEAARQVIERARTTRRPTLLVLDDAAQHEPVAVAGRPLLVLSTTTDSTGATMTLDPLDAAAVATIALEYGDDLPADRLAEESGGVPRRVHAAARRWARDDATRRLGATADRAAGERARLRAAEDDLAAGVVEVQAARERVEPQWDAVACPFKGLASFDIDDADVFFGRERLVAEMVAQLAGAPLLGIVGPSGSGKSSVLKAGLLPALAQGVLPGSDRWAVALLRPGAHPVAAFDQALAQAAPDGRLVIAVDQFEELFAACRDERERAAFADALVAAVRDPRRRALVLIALRADFYGRCASYPELWRMLGANHIPVGPMRRDELRRAIVLPAQRAGLRVDDALVDALVADVQGEPGALPLLSTALLELWQERDGQRLAYPAYERAGGVQGAVARLAERVYAELDPDERQRARSILVRLAGVGEGGVAVRRRLPLAELEPEVLAKLADGRLVIISGEEAEVAHEALLREWPRLGAWLEEDAEGRRLHHHLGIAAREWDARGRDPGELYRGARLAAALDWSAAHDLELDEVERAFVDESRAASGRSQRRLRAVLAGVAGLLVLAVIAGLLALEQRGTAREEATAADAQRLGSRALAENDLDRSLLLARQGVELDDSPQTRGSLLAALNKSPAAVGVLRGAGEGFTGLALSPDGRTLAAGDSAGSLFLFDTRTRRRVRAPSVHAGGWRIGMLAFSPDGRRLAIAHDSLDGEVVTVMETRTRRLGRELRLYDYGRQVTGLSLDGDAVDVASRPSGDRGERACAGRGALGHSQRAADPRPGHARTQPELAAARHERRPARAHGHGRAARGPRRQDAEAGRARRGRDAARQRDRAQPQRPHGRARRARRLRSLPGSAQRQAADGIGPAQRAGDGRALHAGRPLAGDGERGRRGDPVGRRRPRGVRDLAGARQRDHGAADLRRRANPLHRRGRRRDLHLGPRRHAAPRPADRHRCAQRGARGAERGRPAAGARPCERHDHRDRSEPARGAPDVRRHPRRRRRRPASASCRAAGSRSSWDRESSSRSSTPTAAAPCARSTLGPAMSWTNFAPPPV